MDTLSQILLALFSLLMLWGLYTSIKKNPHAFSKQALSSSAYTLALLALLLMALIGLCILLLKN